MNSFLSIGGGLLIGAALASFFYGGLWWTVTRSMSMDQPAWLFLGSYVLRTAVAVGGFYAALQCGWEMLLAALVAFPMSRIALTRRIGVVDSDKKRNLQRGLP